jgi:hypothetical protein
MEINAPLIGSTLAPHLFIHDAPSPIKSIPKAQ